MPNLSDISSLSLTAEETRFIEDVSNSRSGSIFRARRAAMLLKHLHGIPVAAIARRFRCSTATVQQNIEMALQREVLNRRDKRRKKRDTHTITQEMVDWIQKLSCQNPRYLGYSCVEWPASLLAQHVRDHCRAAGYHVLAGMRCTELVELLEWHESRSA